MLHIFANLTNLKAFQEPDYLEEPNSTYIFSVDSKILIQKIKSVVLVVIIVVGLIGNSLNLAIFRRKCMFEISTFKFLFALSANNIFVLLFGGSDVLMNNIYQFEIRNYSIGFCKFHTYITYCVT